MGKCGVCGKDSVSLYYAYHKDSGGIKICQDCWREAYAKNRLVSGSGSSGGCCG